jgi:Uri superfamily endonuclease
MDKGSYCLVMKLDKEKQIPIGRNPPVKFPGGFYCYVGSAMNSLEKRICRHQSRDKARHWHIDWFLEHARLVEVKRIESKNRLECGISQDVARLSESTPMKGFGSSDCQVCKAHLYHFTENPSRGLDRLVEKWKDY